MGSKLYVGNLSYQVDTDSMRTHFSQYGEVTDAIVLTDRDTGRSRGFGFVTFATDEEAKAAAEALNETEFEGRKLLVNEARAREGGGGGGGPRGPRGGGGGGGRREGGGGYGGGRREGGGYGGGGRREGGGGRDRW